MELFGRARSTIISWSKGESVYKERHIERFKGGARTVTYFDPTSFGKPIPNLNLEELKPQAEQIAEPKQAEELKDGVVFTQASPGFIIPSKYAEARRRYDLIKPILNKKARSKKRAKAIEALAAELGHHPATIYRWLDAYAAGGIKALAGNKSGRPKGKTLIPAATYEVILAAFASNPPTTPAAAIHRTLLRVAPELMTYESQGKTWHVAENTIRRFKKQLQADPITNLIFLNEENRKEFLRTWSGKVISNHANDMWQIDMTRCDVMVVHPEAEKIKIFRPRIQYIIDVYSGVIPGLSFSNRENQAQVDLAVRRALFPKLGPLKDKYPVWGTPDRLYVDNGKTYISEHFESYMERLGTLVIHSPALVSHTRGKVERSFGTLHNYEKTLPGYVGFDAKDRDNEGIKKLYKKTQKWLDAGCPAGLDPMRGERLLTFDEYQNLVAAWLIVEYHQWVVDGKTRLQHFLETAPERTMLLRAPEEMIALMGVREIRKIRNGEFNYKNKKYHLANGLLAKYPTGTEIVIIHDDITLGPDVLFVAFDDGDVLTPLGIAEPAPVDALSEGAKFARRVRKAQKRAVLDEYKLLMERVVDSNFRVPNSIIKSLGMPLDELVASSQSIQINRLEAPVSQPKPTKQKEDTTAKAAPRLTAWRSNNITSTDPLEVLKQIEENS